MQNLYDILGVPRTASNKEINAALRQLVRRYNEETAHGAMDSGAALKFVNHARLTFANPDRRAQYDAELAVVEEQQAKKIAEEQARAAAEEEKTLAELKAAAEEKAVAEPRVTAEQKAVEERRAAAQQAPEPLPPVEDKVVAKTPAPVVTPPPFSITNRPSPSPLPAPPTPDVAKGPPTFSPTATQPITPGNMILPPYDLDGGDADDSVLIPIPLDSKTAEMTFFGASIMDAIIGQDLGSVLTAKGRTKQRSTAPAPGLRFAARLIDYGLWGILLGLLVRFLGGIGILSPNIAQLLMGPFLGPIIITLTFVFVEAALLVFFPATPGKLALDIRVATSVSNPYASTEPGALLSASWRRAFWVWWRGVSAGVLPFYIFTMLRARKTLVKSKETTWDFDSDCLVTHGKIGISTVALAALLTGGMVWLYSTHWVTPFWETINASWRYATGGASSVQGTIKTLTGGMHTYAPKELPTAPAKENRTIQLEKTAQELIGKQDWKNLSEHCLAWTKEEERNADAWFCYGRALHEGADHAGAITALKRATLLAPSNDDIRRLLKKSSLIDMQNKQLRMRRAPDQAEPVIRRGTDGGR